MDIQRIYSTLTPDQKAELRSILNAEWDNDLSAKFEQETPTACPKCGHTHFKKNGKVRGQQRYRCVGCKTTFGNTNNTVFYRTQKDLATWNQYIELMFDGFLSVHARLPSGLESTTSRHSTGGIRSCLPCGKSSPLHSAESLKSTKPFLP